MADHEENVIEKKLTTGADIEEDVLLESFKRHEKNNLKILMGLYKGQYFKLFLSMVLFIIKHSPEWVFPIVTANIINEATNPSEKALSNILINAVVMLVLVAQNVLTNYYHTYLYAKTIRDVECGLRSSMVGKLQQLSITYHNEMQSGRLQSKIMRDVEQVENLSAQIFINVLSMILNVVVAFVVVFSTSLTVFLFFLGTAPVAVLIVNIFKNKLNSQNRDFRKEMEETSAKVMEMVELIPVTRAHALEETEINKLDEQLERVAQKGFRLDMLQSFFGSINWASFRIFQIGCLAFTGYLAAKGKILPGDVVMYQTYFSNIVSQVSGLITLIPIISKGLESVDSIGDILLCPDVEDRGGRRKLRKVKGDIKLNDVSFKFRNSEVATIQNLSFHVKPGETVAFVGASGAGKTTVMNLIIGFLRADSGEIIIDGNNIDDLNLQSYRQHIAVVPQTPILFTGTIRENITYGSDDVSEEALSEVVKAANLQDLVESLPKGLDTDISEHGANLSGGQRQRISIARAFVRDPKILILDEATSALDAISEKKIQDSIEQLVKNRTTLIVAHRLSTIRNADRIAVIGDGGLLEIGSYEELMEKKGEFYKLHELQF